MAGRRRKRDKGGAPPVAAIGDDDALGLVPMELSDEQIQERYRELVDWNVKLEQVEEKKKEVVKKVNAELKTIKQRIRVTTRELDTGTAMVDPQYKLQFEKTQPGGFSDTHPCSGSGCVDPRCTRADRAGGAATLATDGSA